MHSLDKLNVRFKMKFSSREKLLINVHLLCYNEIVHIEINYFSQLMKK